MWAVDPELFSRPRAFDDRLGWKNRAELVYYHARKDGGVVRVETNQFGFRDRRLAPDRGVEVRRIVILGDSFTEAMQVDLEETFGTHLKELMNASQDDVYWEVHQYGVGDYGPLQSLLAFKDYAEIWRPEIVVFQAFPYNDIINNAWTGAYLASIQDTYRPYIMSSDSFRHIRFLNETTHWIRRSSRTGRHLVRRLRDAVGPWGREKVFADESERAEFVRHRCRVLGFTESCNQVTLLMNSLAPPQEQTRVTVEGWKVMDEVLRRFDESVAAIGGRFIVLVVPHQRQLRNRWSKWNETSPFTTDPQYAERRMAESLAESEAQVVPLIDTFNRELGTVWPYLDGHFNRPTHRLIGRILFEAIQDQGRDSAGSLALESPADGLEPAATSP